MSPLSLDRRKLFGDFNIHNSQIRSFKDVANILSSHDISHDTKESSHVGGSLEILPKDWRHFDKKPFVAKLDLLKTLKLWNGILSDRVME